MGDRQFLLICRRKPQKGDGDEINLLLMASAALHYDAVAVDCSGKTASDSRRQAEADLKVGKRSKIAVRFEPHSAGGNVKRPIQYGDLLIAAKEEHRTHCARSDLAR